MQPAPQTKTGLMSVPPLSGNGSGTQTRYQLDAFSRGRVVVNGFVTVGPESRRTEPVSDSLLLLNETGSTVIAGNFSDISLRHSVLFHD
jgi:hypothetical protein